MFFTVTNEMDIFKQPDVFQNFFSEWSCDAMKKNMENNHRVIASSQFLLKREQDLRAQDQELRRKEQEIQKSLVEAHIKNSSELLELVKKLSENKNPDQNSS